VVTAVGVRTGGCVLGLVVGCSDRWSGARTSGLMFGPVVECSDQWSGAQTYGLVLGLVVGCLDQWSGARTCGQVLRPVVWCSDWWSGARTCGLVLGLVVGCSGGGCVMAAALRARHACSATASGEPGEVYSVQGLGDGHGQRECAVLVCLEARDGLGLRAHGMERHGRSSKV